MDDLLAREVLHRGLGVFQQRELRLFAVHKRHPLLRLAPLWRVVHHLIYFSGGTRRKRDGRVAKVRGDPVLGLRYIPDVKSLWRRGVRHPSRDVAKVHVRVSVSFKGVGLSRGGGGAEQPSASIPLHKRGRTGLGSGSFAHKYRKINRGYECPSSIRAKTD